MRFAQLRVRHRMGSKLALSLPPLDLWAVYPTGRMPSAKARTFAAFVEAELKAADFRP